MERLLKIALAAFLVAGVSACCPCRRGATRTAVPLTGAAWRLVQMEGRSFGAAGDGFALTFGGDGRVTGEGSCTRLGGAYANDNSRGTLSFTGLVSTRRVPAEGGSPESADAHGPERGAVYDSETGKDRESETLFMQLLAAIDAYTIDGKLLLLFTDGERKLILER